MITNFETTNVLNAQIMGLSTDTKPTTGVQPNSLFWELDTNGMYFFDGTQWQSIGGSGGGGGGGESDFKTLQMTVTSDTNSFSVYSDEQDNVYNCAFINSNNKFLDSVYAPESESVTVTVMYAGDSAILKPFSVVTSVTGNATYDQETGLITATGDFTVVGHMSDD